MRRRSLAIAVASVLVGTGALPFALSGTAQAVDQTSPVVLSEVFGGGGNTGAPYRNDFIELYNSSDQPVDLSSWSVQYGSTSGTTWQRTPLTGSIAPRSTYVIQQAAGANTAVAPLPKVDATGTIAMSGTGAKVALVNNQTALTCGASCASAPGVVDLVGWGGATDSVGAPAAATTNTTSLARRLPTAPTGWDNATDYQTGAPTPGTVTVGTGTPTPTPTTPTPTPTAGSTTIQDIQGPGFVSPLKGETVSGVAGIVTGLRTTGTTKGFWIQQPTKDPAKANASTAVFVYTASAPITAKVGDSVLVSGTVSDYYPLSSGETVATTSNLSMTEITKPVVNVLSSGNPVPAALVLGPQNIPSTYAATPPAGTKNIEAITSVDPTRSAQEFYESHEGELVRVDDARVVGPGKAQYGEIYVTAKPDELRTPRGGTYLKSYAETPTGRLLVMPTDGKVPPASVGDVLSGTTGGPLDWSTYGGYTIAATTLGARVDNGLQHTVVDPAAADQLTVATYNVENLAPSDPATKYTALAQGIVTNLRSPDVVTVEEIQDDTGATNDGTVSSRATEAKLLAAIAAAGGPAYKFAVIDPVDGQDGGQPGGNIRVGLMYNPARVTFVAKPGGNATTAVTVSADTTPGLEDTPTLSTSPGRVDPTNPAWTSSRKPLAGEFVFRGAKVIVVANHFASKGGDQSADGRFQPPNRASEVQRLQQATALRTFVEQVKAVDPQANVVLGGDFNDYQFSPSMTTLTRDGALLTDLMNTLPENQRYSYVFNGISQTLDHMMTSTNLTAAGRASYQVAHINAEFAVQNSDHDPQVARIRPLLHLYAPGSATPAQTTRKPGQQLVINLAGWKPGDTITVRLDDAVVATATIAADGTGVAKFRIPTGAALGTHQVSVSGVQTLPVRSTVVVRR